MPCNEFNFKEHDLAPNGVKTITNKKDSHDTKEMWQGLAIYSFSSLNVGVLMFGGYFLGRFLERHFHWENMAIVGVVVGLVLGLYEMFAFALKSGSKK
ncbi:MAG TPA: hypothetical protein DDW65_08085 [Firmicutes bacterium]|jgi:hypothetical protein|nr:hypothetical protein [Bacillota bacterium]